MKTRTTILIGKINFLIFMCLLEFAWGQCSTQPVSNLVVNGEFTAGNSGFTSGYTYCATSNCQFPEGRYSIGPTATFYHSNFVGTDHTSGSGNFMVVNGAGVLNTIIWQQTITVKPNVTYNFSAWVSSVAAGNAAALQFQINGVTIGSVFNAPPTINDWQNFYVSWFSGASTSAVITILNQNTSLSGNDFGLDDISFLEVCPTPQPSLGEDISLCGLGSVMLNANITPTATTTVTWWDGSSATGVAAPTTKSVNAVGDYWVCVQDGTCTKTDTIKVTAGFTVNLGADITICKIASFELDAGHQNASTQYRWYKNSVLLDSMRRFFWVSSPGTYRVEVTDNSCGLTVSDEIVVGSQSAIPNDLSFCPPTQPTFSVTPNPSGGFKWYTQAVGGTMLGKGNSYTMNTNVETTLYAEDTTSFYYNVGAQTKFGGGFPSNTFTNYFIFDAMESFTLKSVTVFANIYNPNAAMSIGVTLRSNTGALITQSIVNVVGPPIVPSGNVWPFTVPVNISVPVQNNLRLSAEGSSGQLFWAQQGGNVVNWSAYQVPNVIRIKSLDPGMQWPGCNCYGFFYNWEIEKGTSCSRTPVRASLNCPLPVEWLHLSAEENTLCWSLLDYEKVQQYEILHAYDGVHFSTYTTVPGSKVNQGNHCIPLKDFSEGYFKIIAYATDESSSSPIVRLSSQNEVSISPNPTSSDIKITSEQEISSIEVYAMNGQPLLHVLSSGISETINLSEFSAGPYIVKIHSERSVTIRKVIKE
jgi:hypothetical protein